MQKQLLIAFAVGVMTIPVWAKPAKKVKKPELYEAQWQRIYGGKDDDEARAVVALENGDSAIVGTCKSYDAKRRDICVMRMARNGDMRWRILIGGKKNDEGMAIARSADGNLLVLGHSKSYSQNYDYDLLVAKVSLDGKVMWQKSYGASRDEKAGGIAGTDDGGAMIVGTSESFDARGMKDIYLVKVDKNGKAQRIRHLGGEGDDGANGIARTRDGKLVAVGYHETTRPGDYDFFLMKMTQTGDILWTKSFGGEYEDELTAVTATPDNGIVATGKTRSYGSSQTDLTVMKLDADGKTIWHKIYGFKYYEYGNAVALTRDREVMVVGGTNTLGKGDHDVYVLVLDERYSDLLWSHAYGGESKDIGYGVARLSDGTMLVVGKTESFKQTDKMYFIKLQKRKK